MLSEGFGYHQCETAATYRTGYWFFLRLSNYAQLLEG